MDFMLPEELVEDLECFRRFLGESLIPNLSNWYHDGSIPRGFFEIFGRAGWFSYSRANGVYVEHSALKQAVLLEELAKHSPGVAVAVAAHMSLGTMGIYLFGSKKQKEVLMDAAVRGETLLCLGNTEAEAGSDVASIATQAKPVAEGWVLNGTKAYTTNGGVSDYGLITAVTDPRAERNRRMSMFLVDLSLEGVLRRILNKEVWIPSDLTRLQFRDVFVPEENLVGERGRGLQQVLEIFTHSRISISALTLGTAAGAFATGFKHGRTRRAFGEKIVNFQAKSFETADFYSKIQAARLMLWKACWLKDQGEDFRLQSSIAKYLAVEVARAVSVWAADLFGAASVIFEHPVHKYPMDAWAASLGEGTQDIQKLVIFRELMKRAESRG